MNRKLLFFVFMFILPGFFAHASVVITEIMYDVEGADTGREWVEIQNTGPNLDLTGWKFFENGVNHGLVLSQGTIFIPQNGFAIIADNTEKFLLDWPNFEGTIFDSSFSLSNSGETFILRDAGLGDQDTATYSSDIGGSGDGKSLQKSDSEWVSALPTPSKTNSEENNEQPPSPYLPAGATALQAGQGGAGGGDEDLEEISISIPEPKPSPFQAFAGKDRSALAGAEVYFEGQVDGLNEDMISKARFLWNFGDGTIGEGKNIKHNFLYPGNYIVNLDASFGMYSDSDSLKIGVSPAGIVISEAKPGEWIKIKNDSTKISDVSGFGIQINNSKIFNFPKNTSLAANSFLTLDSLTLGIEIPDAGEVKILYPNGKILFSSQIKNTHTSPTKVGGTLPSKGGEIIEKTPLLDKEGVGGGEASVISSQTGASFWSEIKWLVFGLGIGVVIGVIYLFLRRHFRSAPAL